MGLRGSTIWTVTIACPKSPGVLGNPGEGFRALACPILGASPRTLESHIYLVNTYSILCTVPGTEDPLENITDKSLHGADFPVKQEAGIMQIILNYNCAVLKGSRHSEQRGILGWTLEQEKRH